MAIPVYTVSGENVNNATQTAFNALNPLEVEFIRKKLFEINKVHCYLEHCGYPAIDSYTVTVKSGRQELKAMFIAACDKHHGDLYTICGNVKDQYKMWYQPKTEAK